MQVFSQPMISAGNAPVPGTTFTMHIGTYYNLPQTGAGQTWNYSNIGGGGGFSYVMGPADLDPQAQNFPNADLVRTGDGNRYFHSAGAGGVFFHGHISPFGNLFLDDPLQDMKYPLLYGTSWSDDFSGSLGIQSISGTINCSANGHGTLILPWGSINDVVRVRCRMVATIPEASVERVDTLTFFYADGFPWHLLRASKRVIYQNGQAMPQILELEYASQASVVAVEEQKRSNEMLHLFPSPTQDQLNIRSPHLKRARAINIYDGQGRVIRSEMLEPAHSADGFNIHVGDLPQGLYVLQLVTEDGLVVKQRFMVNP